MHVPPASRARALRKLATLLSPNGRIAISLRLDALDATRAMCQDHQAGSFAARRRTVNGRHLTTVNFIHERTT